MASLFEDGTVPAQPRASLFSSPLNDPVVARATETDPFLTGLNVLVQATRHSLFDPLSSAVKQYQGGDVEDPARTLSLFAAPFTVDANGAAATAFMKSPAGDIDWGMISPEAAQASAGKIQSLPIRVSPGNAKFGYQHIDADKAARIKDMGFTGTDDFLDYVAKNHNVIVGQPNGRIGLVVSPGKGDLPNGKPAHNYLAVELRPEGDHYGVTTAMPDATASYLKSGGKSVLWRQGPDPTN